MKGWTNYLPTWVWCLLLVPLSNQLFSQEVETRHKQLLILDDSDDRPLPSVLVATRLKQTTSDIDGRVSVSLTGLQPTDTVTFLLTGYDRRTILVRELTRIKGDPAPFYLTFGTTSLSGVDVEGVRPLPSPSLVGERLDGNQLRESTGEGLAEILTGVKGLSMISSGTTSAVPVIHGMSGERILVVTDGVRLEGQQWNNDLSSEVDTGNAGTITVLKGAESVRFGSDALGGVILVEESTLPYGGAPLGGEALIQYGSNGHTVGGRLGLEGGLGSKDRLAYRIQGSYHDGGDRSTAKYLLNNTGVKGYTLSARLGYLTSHYGAELKYGLTGHKEGILFEAKMGNVELLKQRIELGHPLETLPFSRDITYPFHKSQHQFVVGKGFYQIPDWGRLSLRIAYQNDQQDEYHRRRLNRSEIPSVSMRIDNIQGDLKWKHTYLSKWSSEAGLQGQVLKNTNRPGTGVVPLIPNYAETTLGLYFIQKYHSDKWGLEGGLRGDFSRLVATGYDNLGERYGGVRHFRNFTYTLGGHIHLLENLALVSQFGTAWRAPHVGELWSNGIDSTGSLYLKGDSTMTSELSNKWITSLSYEGRRVKVALEGYLSWVNGYIYKEPTRETFTIISGVYPLFRYRQTSAKLHGLDAEVNFQITPWVEYHAQGGMIWASERQTGRYLPYIPPFRLSHGLTFSLPFLEKSFVEANHRYVAQQKRFDPDTDLIPFAPPAYHLFGLRAGSTYRFSDRSSLTLLLSVENLFNLEYKEYTNSARYYAHEAGRDIRVSLRYTF